MSRLLPIRPDLEHLKNEARSLLKAHDAGDRSACPVLRKLRRFANAADADVLAAAVALSEAQFALALEYGFRNWEELRRVVLRARPAEGSQEPPRTHALRLPDPPPGGDGNRFTRGYQMAFSYCGVACDYDTVAGDSGLAFILQADSGHTPYGAEVKELDLGWWPLDDWGAMLRLDFLGRVHGIELRRLPAVVDEYRSDAAAHFAKYHRGAFFECLRAGRPAAAVTGGCDNWLVTGMDDGSPPLLGQLCCDGTAQVKRLGQYPWCVVVLGDGTDPMDRAQADAEAIAFACHLHHERFSRAIPGCAAQYAAVKSSGKASFALWARTLRDGVRCGPSHFSANIVGCTLRNRRSTPPYLRQMASRHDQPAKGRLLTAADIHDEVLAKLATADTSKAAFSAAAGREKLADVVDQLAALEAKAAGELELALRAMDASERPARRK
jgi:hypothetical protein